MNGMSGKFHLNRIILIISVAIISVCLFLICYKFDNKYTYPGPVAQNGILILDRDHIEKYPIMYLIHGWEVYPEALLSPDDFSDTAKNFSIIAGIGEYGGFEWNDKTKSPHGSSTYRLNIIIPDELNSYTLELPEIYSAYRLYINGIELASMGCPEVAGYYPETGNSSVTFQAAGYIEILLSVSDYSYSYSGLVYPPAFGNPEAVSNMLLTRLCIRLAIAVAAFIIGLFYIIVGLQDKNRMTSFYYGLLCFCFMGSTAYPIVKTLWHGGMQWYRFEKLCYVAMFMFVVLISRDISGRKNRINKVISYFCVFTCLFTGFANFFVNGNLFMMSVYSSLIDIYIYICALSLTINLVENVFADSDCNMPLVASIVMFDTAIIMDRMLPVFEPILTGWFVEIAGMALVIGIGFTVTNKAVKTTRENSMLEIQMLHASRLVDMQRTYYPVIIAGHEASRLMRHDMRHHMKIIRELAQEGSLSKLIKYLEQYKIETPKEDITLSGNHVVDIILRHFSALFEQNNISFDYQINIDKYMSMQDADIASVISNLLENALEACLFVSSDKRRWVNILIKQYKVFLCVEVSNSFDGYIETEDQHRFLSRKQKDRTGIGTLSVKEIATRYGGHVEFLPDCEKCVFVSRVWLRIQSTDLA